MQLDIQEKKRQYQVWRRKDSRHDWW